MLLCCILPLHQGNVLLSLFVDVFGQYMGVIHFFLQILPTVRKYNTFSFSFSILSKHSLSSLGCQDCLCQHFSLAKLFTESLFPPLLDVSVSLLSLLVTTCGLALFSVSLFVSWKLCWVPLSGRFLPDVLKGAHFLGGDQQPVLTEVRRKRVLVQ